MREETGGKRRGNERSMAFTGAALALCALMIVGTATWIQRNEGSVKQNEGAKMELVSAPKQAEAGEVIRFKAKVTDRDGKTPMPNRVVDVTVGPEPDAQILSITGGAQVGEKAAQLPEANHVQGRTDASGHVEVLLRATQAGDYTLSFADTASLGSAQADFRVNAPGG